MNTLETIQSGREELKEVGEFPSNLYDVEEGRVPALYLKPTLDWHTQQTIKQLYAQIEEI